MDYILIIFLLASLLLIIYIYFSWIISSIKYWIPQVWTYSSDFLLINKYLKNLNWKWKRLLDLWSWTWRALRFFEKAYWMKTTWYEIDLWNYIISKFLNYLFNCKSEIHKKNYNDAQFKNYNFIYLYLFPKNMMKLEDHIFKKADKWTIIIANSFKFPKNKPIEIIKNKKWKDRIFIYKV